MTWRDSLRAPTFRGVGFKVDVSEYQGGRRTVTHEYPLRDMPFVEDMGRKARRFPVEAYIVGPDYHTARDALIDALEQSGPGELVHPRYGIRRVAVSNFRTQETREEGGMCRFFIDFEETEQQGVFPIGAPDPAGTVIARANAVLSQLQSAFDEAYSVAGQPQFALDSLVTFIQGASGTIEGLLAPFLRGADIFAEWSDLLASMFDDAPADVRDSDAIYTNFAAALEPLAGLPLPPKAGLPALMQIYEYTSGSPLETTATRIRETENRAALLQLNRTIATAEAAKLAAVVEYESYDEAVAYRDRIALQLDTISETAPDSLYTGLVNLRAAIVAAVPAPAQQLPRILTYEPLITQPSLVIAHELYGGIAQEPDILARNRIRHPGFVTGGRPLEILSRG